MYTQDQLINQAKSAEAGIMGTHVPYVSVFYGDFIDTIGLDHDAYYHISKYIKGVDYNAKRHLFESLGFKVLYMTLSAMKVSRFLRDDGIDTPSIDQEFLDGKRNVFIFEVEQGMGDCLYFILEYKLDGDPLCDHTVDREELARELARKAEVGQLFKVMRENRERRKAAGELDDNPFS